MNITVGDYEYQKGNISSTQTIEKMFMTIDKAQAYAQKLDDCVGFSIEHKKQPSMGTSREFMCHFKSEPATVMESKQWHTYLAPKDAKGTSQALKPSNKGTGAATLQVPGGGKSKHKRTVTNFCREANIGQADQLDLAEFIVAARYLGTSADDDQLMNVFMDMEDTDADGKDPKQLIKDLMKKVEDEYDLTPAAGDAKEDADEDQELMAANPLDAFAEDAIWQEDQIDSFLNQNQADQNLNIARNLLATTALTRHEIAEITGVQADLLKDYESEYSDSEEDDEDDEEDDGDEDGDEESAVANDDEDNKDNKEASAAGGAAKGAMSGGVTIQSSDFSKSVMLTKSDLGTLKTILDGGKDTVSEKNEEALKLLTKLQQAINMNPKGHSKNKKTLAKLKVSEPKDKKDKKDKEVKLPAKYRVVIHPGALCKETEELSSKEVCKLPIGTVVTVVEIKGRRARVTSPSKGWLSLHASDGRVILQRSSVKSAAMDKAIHAERARQTKVLILKSITTLNDATVTRILEKSDWNLRRAIEAFYIAKYKTQEYLTKKEAATTAAKAGAAPSSKSPQASPNGGAKGGAKGGKKGKSAWWKSWKTFAHENP